MTDMQVMDKMAADNLDIRMCPDIVEVKKVKKGGEITFGVPAEVYEIISKQVVFGPNTHYVAMYIINKDQFDKIKNKK